MAAVHVTDEDAFCCSVCLHTLKDPVTIPCGHSYCKGCISGYWDHKDGKGEYSCPQCRETFSSKPVLNKNTVLAELVVKMKGNGAEKQSHPVAEEVPCDICTGEKKTCAVKTCLVCLVSLCQTHIQPHYEFAAYKRHKLVKALTNLQEKICPLHDKLLEVFCLTDQSCICMLCTVDEHKGHETTSVISEMTQKQKQLGEQQRELKKHIELKEKELQELENAVEDYRSSAEAAVLETERIFAEVIQSIEKKCTEVKEVIRSHQKAAVGESAKILDQLKHDIAEMKRRDTELKQLSHNEDHIMFLQNTQALFTYPESEELPRFAVSPYKSFEALKESLNVLKTGMEGFLENAVVKVYKEAKITEIISPPEPQTREDFLQYLVVLHLDIGTAHRELCVSEENTQVTRSGISGSRSHPERFDNYRQVLCSQGLSGRCYWEVYWNKAVEIVVSYKGIDRKAMNESGRFGEYGQSWKLICQTRHNYTFCHKKKEFQIPVAANSPKVGVYLDHKAGTLSFYRVSDQMTLLYRVQATFSEPLYPGFWLDCGSTIKICSQ